ncbi:hypothetical protein GD494_09595 [Salmonella enterica]|nr:hypothetical protein [Salmonella enterica]EDJ5350199.1 hypothetical protein [Salmonella enterica subsp. enterica serovar Meleagridis]EDJ8363909.1 hypothetical protein [Salmonella enterica subsp. enterica serovar Meleagridis]EDK0033635.1 hypothetical protein [Salmonella enterica]EDK0064983.1 hypothetical protein [Salmonella enterica]
MTVLIPIFSVFAVSRTSAPLKAISTMCSLTPGLRLHRYKTTGKRVYMAGNESARAGKNYDHDDKFHLNGNSNHRKPKITGHTINSID